MIRATNLSIKNSSDTEKTGYPQKRGKRKRKVERVFVGIQFSGERNFGFAVSTNTDWGGEEGWGRMAY